MQTNGAAFQSKKIAIVGTAPSRNLAPTHDPEWQIWTCSGGNIGVLSRVNVWFELHAPIEMMAPENRAVHEPFYKWLAEQTNADHFTCVMQEAGTALGGPNALVPKAVPFPLDEIIAAFGRNWLTSSIAQMMALAILRGAEEIGLFGVDMAATQEHYEAQRAGCTRFIEIAQERGIKVTVPFDSSLMAVTPIYGYWEGTPFGRRLNATARDLNAAYAQAAAEEQAARDRRIAAAAALEQIRYFQRTWTDGSELELDHGFLAAGRVPATNSPQPAPVDGGQAGPMEPKP